MTTIIPSARSPPATLIIRKQINQEGESQSPFRNVHYFAFFAWVFSLFPLQMYKMIASWGCLTCEFISKFVLTRKFASTKSRFISA